MDNYNSNYNNTSLNQPNFNMNGTQLTPNSNQNNDIKMLSQEILDGLNNNNISLHDNDSVYKSSKKKKNKKEDKKEMQNDYDSDAKCLTSFLFEKFNLKELIMLFSLYFVLSQDTVREFFAGYFSSLNPDAEGKINIQGILTYGLILTVLFFILKMLFV